MDLEGAPEPPADTTEPLPLSDLEASSELPGRRRWFWAGLVAFLAIVAVLSGLFYAAAQEPARDRGYQAYTAPPPIVPVTVIAEPATAQPAATVSSMREVAASTLLSLPGQEAGLWLLGALQEAGQDPITAEVVRTLSTSVNEDGSVSSFISVSLLLDSGFAEAIGVAANGGVLWYSPPILTFPAVPDPGSTWSGEGLTNGIAPFSFEGDVLDGVRLDTAPGPLDGLAGCRDVQTTIEQEFPGGEGYTSERITTWCPGWGSVASEDLVTGARTRLGSPRDATWTDAVVSSPSPRPAGTRLAFPTSLVQITRPPVTAESGLVVVNDATHDLLSLTVTPPLADTPDTNSTALWIQHPGGQVLGMAGGEDRTFVTSSLRALLAFDNAGRMRWSARLPDVAVGSPAVIGDVVAVALVDGTLRGFQASGGQELWSVRLSDVVLQPPVSGRDEFVVADSGGYVVAVGADGQEKWGGSLSRVDQPLTALGDGSYLFAQATGFLTRLDASGEETWTVPLLEGMVLAGGVLRDGVIVLPTDEGLLGLDVTTGEVLWANDDLSAASLAPDGTLVADRGRVLSLALDGSTDVVAQITEASGATPTKVYLAPMGTEWVALTQEGSMTFLGVARDTGGGP